MVGEYPGKSDPTIRKLISSFEYSISPFESALVTVSRKVSLLVDI